MTRKKVELFGVKINYICFGLLFILYKILIEIE